MTSKPVGVMAEMARIRKSKNVLLGELEKAELAEFEAESDRRADVLHPSEMAKKDWCYRASYLRIKNNRYVKDEKFSAQMQRIFATGNEAHTKWQRRMRQTGKLWGDWRCTSCAWVAKGMLEPPTEFADGCTRSGGHIWEYREVSLHHGLVAGHEDGAMDDYLVEVKTIGTGTVRHDAPKLLAEHYKEVVGGGKIYDIDSLWKSLTRPFPTHVRQANVYLWLAKQMGLPFTRVRFLYELKHNSSTKEFSVPLSDRIMEPILTGIRVVEYALEQGVPPECNQRGDGVDCSSCRPYNEEFNAKPESPGGVTAGGEPGGAVPRKRVVRRRAEAQRPGDRTERVGSPTDGDAPRAARRRDGAGRPRADEAVHQPVEVDQVPDGSGSSGNGRRVVRRKGRSAGEDA